MPRPLRIIVAFTALISAGCAGGGTDVPAPAMTALQNAEKYELLSLDPNRSTTVPPDNFHGWKVLGRVSVEDAATRKKLNDALRDGARGNDGMAAACFNPRHGIRATPAAGGQPTDLVICFECLSANVYQGGQKTGSFLTTESPQPTFDRVLRAANVPLAADAE